ncbi:hypothetical protein LSCM1_03909 [Leishmania martiniquensis]|uniref:Uncharacterized protein n=1 Tax=Leishmania martiniquensis TaxID=1580590 RepID=A0A836KNP8_9TRYP|nr:hypothetical protein LSCM1_03909 [Leishmania martiniquensis]
MFSLLNDLVASAAEAVKSISDQGIDVARQTGVLDALERVVANPDSAAANTASQEKTLSVADIMTPPATWAGSTEDWVWCVDAALCDPNTCALAPASLQGDAPLWEEVKTTVARLLASPPQPEKEGSSTLRATGKGAEASAALASNLLEKAGVVPAPAADLVKYIQEHYEVYRVRSYTVPRFISDEGYWLNIGWRIDLYKQCTNAEQLLTLMQTLSRLPQRLHLIAAAAEERAASKAGAFGHAEYDEDDENCQDGYGETYEENIKQLTYLTDNTEYWNIIRMQYEAIQEKRAWLQEMEGRVKKEMELARGNVKLLSSLLQRKEASTALGASVFDSCQYHKVKLSRLIADICAAPAEHRDGTVLDSRAGRLFHALVNCNDDVKAALEAYAGRPPSVPGSPKGASSSPASSAPASAKQGSPAGCEEPSVGASTPETTTSAPHKSRQTTGSSPVELKTAASGSTFLSVSNNADDSGEESFEAKLPWSAED